MVRITLLILILFVALSWPVGAQTPPAGETLAQAQRALAAGDYDSARQKFAVAAGDPGLGPEMQPLALYGRGRSELELGDFPAAIATFSQFLQQYPGETLARAAHFNLGRAYQASSQVEAALEAYRGALGPDDPINSYIYERMGSAAQSGNLYPEALAAYQAGLDSTADDAVKARLREQLAAVELAQGNPAGAIAQYEAILLTLEDTFQRAKILRLLGQAYLAANNPAAAHERYLAAVTNYPAATDSYAALAELLQAGVAVGDFEQGLVNYYAKDYAPAIAAFERYLAQADPAANLAAEALWLTALSWQGSKSYDNAVTTLERYIAAYPASDRWGEANIQLGYSLIDQGDYARAKSVLREFAAAHPDHPLAPQAVWRPARLEFDQHELAEARPHFQVVADLYPASSYASDSLFWAGQAAYRLQDYEGALADWQRLIDTYPTNDLVDFAGYWQGKALLALGRDDEARAVLGKVSDGPLNYYRLRARALLDQQPPVSIPLTLPGPDTLAAEQAEAETWLRTWLGLAETTPLSEPGPSLQADPAFQRGQTLLTFGLRADALAEFQRVKDSWWGSATAMYQLALYFQQHQLGQLSISCAARLIALSPARAPEDAPLFIQRLYYPIYFDDVILTEAATRGLDPALVVALIRQESLFEASAESPVGARGLMQVMPTTGERIIQQSDLGNFRVDQLWTPYVNIKFGSWYLRRQLELFNDNQFAALAAYNAGSDNVAEWLQVSDDLDIFVEAISFRESRTYIRRIYENLAAYRRLYGSPAP